MALINVLIDTPDGFELIRDQIAAILATEIANQEALAPGEGADPDDFKALVFTERTDPFDHYVEIPPRAFPIVNVWFESMTQEKNGSTSDAQRGDGVFNVDVYGFGISADNPAGGHFPGDRSASLECSKWIGMVRRILMSAQYTWLGSPRGASQFCFGRWMESAGVFQPEIETRPLLNVTAARLSITSHFLLTQPQNTGELSEIISTTVHRESDGRILAEVTADFT